MLGHLAGGGAPPDLAVLLVVLPLFAVLFVRLAQRRTGLRGKLVALGGGQFVLHNVLALVHVGEHTSGSTAMLAAHAVVTVVLGVALQYADVALAALVGALARVLPRRFAAPPADRPLRTAVVPFPGAVARLLLAHCTVRVLRGPPVAC